MHFGKHVVADMAQETLRYDRHRLIVKDGSTERHEIHQPHAADDEKQILRYRRPRDRRNYCAVRKSAARQRINDLIENEPHEKGGTDTCRRGDRDTDKYGDHTAFIIMEEIREQSAEQFETVPFRLALHFCRSDGYGRFTHLQHLLSALRQRSHCLFYSVNNKLPDRSRW